ncbi:hypothetical protein GCM10027431_06030 [Lysobacter rhizosphaerae]
MVAQPQALAEHLAHGVADRVRALFTRYGRDFGPRHAEPGFQRIGRIQQFLDRAGPALWGPLAEQDRQQGRDACCEQDPDQGGWGHGVGGWKKDPQSEPPAPV